MMRNKLTSFLRRSNGNVTVFFAIAVVPLLLALGSAVDYMRFNDARTAVQAALDGAALAAALPTDLNDHQRIALAKKYFKGNLSYQLPGGDDIDLNIKITTDSVLATVNTVMPTTFMRIGGIETMTIFETSEVSKGFSGKAEVVLVLDYSTSMETNNKYKRMAAAADDMLESLDEAIAPGRLKVGLVPFSAMVYTSMDSDYVMQASATSTWTGCTMDRAYPNNTNVDTPNGDNDTLWGYIDSSNIGKCANYVSKKLLAVPLTDDVDSVRTKLAAMLPVSSTNIPLGAEFGWNMLDPALPFDEALPYTDKENRKFLVVLTDGMQTSKQWGPGGSRDVENGNNNLKTICKGARDAGITVFTIAYDITDPVITTLLSECAPGQYYEPSASNAEITKVFAEITKVIKKQTVRLSK